MWPLPPELVITKAAPAACDDRRGTFQSRGTHSTQHQVSELKMETKPTCPQAMSYVVKEMVTKY